MAIPQEPRGVQRQTDSVLVAEVLALRARVRELEQQVSQPRAEAPSLRSPKARSELESQLHAERTFGNAVLDTVAALIIVIDAQGRIVRFNRACEQATGYAEAEVQGLPFYDILLTDEECAAVVESFQQFVAGDFPNQRENHLIGKSGECVLISWNNTALLDSEGRVEFVIGTGLDVTQHRRSLDAFRESEARFRALIENLPFACWSCDQEGHTVLQNTVSIRDWGDLTGVRQEDIALPADVLATWVELNGRAAAGEVVQREFVVENAGVTRTYSTLLAPIFDGDVVRGTVGASIDITDRKQAEEALRRGEEYYRTVLENAFEGLSIVDAQGITRFTSQSTERLLGYPLQEIVGHDAFDRIHPDDVAFSQRSFAEILSSSADAKTYELRYLHKDGSWRNLEVRAINLLDNPTVQGIVTHFRDITERTQAEQALRFREEFERLIMEISGEFVNLPPDQFDLGIQQALEVIGRFVGVAHSYLLLFRGGGRELDMSHEWCQHGIVSLRADFQGIAIDDELPAFGSRLRACEVFIARAAEFPAVAKGRLLLSQSDQSLLVVPLVSSGVLLGGLVFDKHSQEPWNEQAVGLLRVVGEIIANAISRSRAELTIRSSEARLRRLVDSNMVGILFWNADGDITEANDAFLDLVGYSRDELRQGKLNWKAITPPEFLPQDEEALKVLARHGKCAPFEKEYVRKDGTRIPVLLGAATVEHATDRGVCFLVDIRARKKAEAALVQARDELELRVAERTSNLTATNLQLHREVADREAAEMALVTEQMLLRRLLNLQEHDRKLVAYDIHDGLVQYITAALMQLEAFAQVAQAPEPARDKFVSAVQMLRNTIAEARRLISGLRPPILDESGIVPAIEYLLHEQSHPAVEFTHDVQDDRLSPPVEGALFRVCQEAVTNARKYSQAKLIQVSLVQDRYRIRLEIRDDGVGFDPSTVRGKKFGLQGIRERARLLGGRVKIESSAEAGTLVAVDLPI